MAATPKPVRQMTKKIAAETREHTKTVHPAVNKVEMKKRVHHAKKHGEPKKSVNFVKSQYQHNPKHSKEEMHKAHAHMKAHGG